MEKKEIIWIASRAAAKGYDYEKITYMDDLYGYEHLAGEVWSYVVEYKEIGSIAFREKYKDYKLY